MAPTRAERAAVTRQKLLDAAVEQFAEKPYDDVSVQDIATAAGVAYGLVAHHFGNKRGLQLDAVREISRRLEPGPLPPGPASLQIRHFARAHFATIERHPVAYVGLMLGTDADTRAIFDASRERGLKLVVLVLGLDTDRPAVRLALRSCLAAVDEAAVIWLQDGRQFPVEGVIEMLMATLAEMLRQAAKLDPAFDPSSALSALEPIAGDRVSGTRGR
ncbi:MAG TPA: helix-turn-helix domain-containing protein [Kribbella sp.]